jgi:small GTP-binding protein
MSVAPRVVVIGSASVGKTSLVNRIIADEFVPTTPTTGIAFFRYKFDSPDESEIQLWDSAGMERYRSVNKVFYREAIAAILVFDLSNHLSFEELDGWYREFVSRARPNALVVLCAGKSDLVEEREVLEDEIRNFCQAHDNIPYFETSALTGDGVGTMMKSLTAMLPDEENAVQTDQIESELKLQPKSTCC